jgi:hypothetical protein
MLMMMTTIMTVMMNRRRNLETNAYPLNIKKKKQVDLNLSLTINRMAVFHFSQVFHMTYLTEIVENCALQRERNKQKKTEEKKKEYKNWSITRAINITLPSHPVQ